jgi:hypothetical protein
VRFRIEQHYTGPLDDVVAVFADPDFYRACTGLPKLSPPGLLSLHRDGVRVSLELRQRYVGELPAAATAVIDPARLTWVQRLELDLSARTATTVLVPDHYADRFSCQARYSFVADGDSATLRELTGDVKVRVLLVGGKVESALVDGLRDYAEAEAGIVASRLAPR